VACGEPCQSEISHASMQEYYMAVQLDWVDGS
jgi:hypothetical protein